MSLVGEGWSLLTYSISHSGLEPGVSLITNSRIYSAIKQKCISVRFIRDHIKGNLKIHFGTWGCDTKPPILEWGKAADFENGSVHKQIGAGSRNLGMWKRLLENLWCWHFQKFIGRKNCTKLHLITSISVSIIIW